MTSQPTDVTAVLVTDHREVERMFGEVESTTDRQRHRELADQIIIELVRHSVAEEQYVYPAVRDLLPRGDELADHEIEEHSEAERTMKELDGLDPADPRFDQLMRKLIDEIRHHVEDEERDLFPQLRQHADPEKLAELGRKVEQAKKIAPTRPHPSAPDTPPLNKLLAPGAGLVDRMRDAFTGRGRGS